MAKVYLGLGTNLGDKKDHMRLAVSLIRERIGKVVSQSSYYDTAPWGFESESSFLNAVICVSTLYKPLDSLRLTLTL